MRKLKLQMQQTVNGFVGGPNGEMDWMTLNHNADDMKYITELTQPVDCIVMGRKLAQGFIPYWASEASNPQSPQLGFARKMHDTQKVVFSKTMEKSEWQNAKLAKGSLADEINALKTQPGGDMIVYGGADFVSNLIQEALIDEFHFFVNPAALCSGLTIFKHGAHLKLIKATTFGNGVVALHYELLKAK